MSADTSRLWGLDGFCVKHQRHYSDSDPECNCPGKSELAAREAGEGDDGQGGSLDGQPDDAGHEAPHPADDHQDDGRQREAPERECARCGRHLVTRRGDNAPTCSACRKPPGRCSCKSLLDQEQFAPPTNPLSVARQILEDQWKDGCLTLHWWRGGWTRWGGTCWAEDELDAVRSRLYQRLEHAVCNGPEGLQPWEPNQRKISDVADALKAVTHLPEATETPSWLADGKAPFPAAEAVTCENGILHVRSGKLYPLTPRLFSHVSVPFPYDSSAPEPGQWLAFLRQLWPDDPDSIQALREWFGYVLSGRTDMHKLLLMVGPPRSGKGTIARVLGALAGQANVVGPTLSSLCTQFGLQPLIGKPLAIVGDARLSHATDVGAVVERLLSISGEDMQTIDRKHKPMWTGKLSTRFVIISNELPAFADSSGAIASRFLILTLQNSFLGQEDHGLTEKLFRELPGILRWSLEGLGSLVENGKFTVPQSSDDATATLQDLASPVAGFVRDMCELKGEVVIDDLWQAWRTWADDSGQRQGSKAIFSRNLAAAYPALRQYRPREGQDGEDRRRRYEGISLRNAAMGISGGPQRTTPSTSGNAGSGQAGQADQVADHERGGSAGPPGSAGPDHYEPLTENSLCAVCHQSMRVIEPGQTTHPLCDPGIPATDGDGVPWPDDPGGDPPGDPAGTTPADDGQGDGGTAPGNAVQCARHACTLPPRPRKWTCEHHQKDENYWRNKHKGPRKP